MTSTSVDRIALPDDLILLDVHADGVAVLTLNDPATRNSLSDRMMHALLSARQALDDLDAVRVVVVTGTGADFSAGGNLDDMSQRSGVFASEDPFKARDVNLRVVHKIPLAVHGIEVPTIAAVNGHAIGGGCDVALMCDIRLASQRAVFGESFLRVGLLPGDGGAWFLPRVVGLSRAMEMVLTAEFIDAGRAAEIGLVSRVVEHERLLEEALVLARRIARQPPNAARMSKRLLRFGAEASLADTLEMTANMQAQAQTSEEHRAAVARLAAAIKKR
ncbi:MAG: enoyl-CoA hydratase/isomerase family protein [Burkholderiales bacterium]|nr:enoyl-CoA hydratase/isomerase family protein [Burkholderiales bacterium]ODU70425.1 MAG: enoyl-CoA hydratase [Lautropia sp. SCN 66-9]